MATWQASSHRKKYRIVISNNAWTRAALAHPRTYLAAALGVRNAVAQCKQFVAEHKVLQSSYTNYLGMEEAGKELILYAVGNDALAPLKKQYIGFGDTRILSMLDHLRQKTAIRMTTTQKYEYKNVGFNAPWDPTTSITAYFTSLDRFQISLGDCSIATSNAKKTMAAGAQMWNSDMFTEDQMLSWENKPAIDQTWPNLQTYFTKKMLDRKQYLATTAKQFCFKEAALLARETAAAEEEGETQAMLFAMLQEQHNKQMATMAASNKANMDAMMERMRVSSSQRWQEEQQQGEHISDGKHHTRGQRRGRQQNQEGQAQEKTLSQLQNICLPHPRQMLRVGGKQGHSLPQVDVSVCGKMTSAGDRQLRSM
jgi:hypothetical protein